MPSARKEHTMVFKFLMVSPENIQRSKLIQTELVVFRCLGRDTYITTINAKRGHEFEREQGRIYGKDWREERKGGNDVIIL